MSPDAYPWLWATALLPATTLALTWLNALTWPRGRPSTSDARVSILVPARNEEATIRTTVVSALAQRAIEVLVYDDLSDDRTPDILAELSADDSRLRTVAAVPLPAGWVGKPHACHRLAAAAEGDLLLFLDADVELAEGAVDRIVGLLEHYRADVVTAVPRQVTGSFAERLIVPLLHLTYLSWLPLPLIWLSKDARFLAANGQILAVRRAAYDAAGGFEAVRSAVVDDMEFCRAQKRTGHRVVFADGHEIGSCRMYQNARGVWEGFSKNIFEGLGSAVGLFAALALYLGTFVLPWLLLALSFAFPPFLLPAAAGVAANLAQRLTLAVRYAQPLDSVLLHPIGVLGLCLVAVNSWIWHLRGDIRWAGRSYAKRDARG